MDLLEIKIKVKPLLKELRAKGYSWRNCLDFFNDCIKEVKQDKCTHENAVITVEETICTIEYLCDYCPDCELKWNHRIDI